MINIKKRYVCVFLGLLLVFCACKTTGTGTDSLTAKGISREQAEAKIQELDAARDAAIAAGVEGTLPQRFALADDDADSARERFENGDYQGAFEDASAAYEKYTVLTTICEAYNLKMEADEYNFIVYAPEDYETGADAGNMAVDLFDEDSMAEAQESAEQALDKFNLVLETGWKAYVDEKSAEAQEWKQAALDAKANVAVKDVFQNADLDYDQAFVAVRAGEYRSAGKLFIQSGTLFRQGRDMAVEKRVRAEEAVRQAEEKVAESEAKAKEAQEIVGEE